MRYYFLFSFIIMTGICYTQTNLSVDYLKENASATLPNSGSIQLNITAQNNIPYSILWEDGSTDENRFGLAVGNYSVTVTGNSGDMVSKQISILNKVIWQDIIGLNVQDNLVDKTRPKSWSNNGMSSLNEILPGEDGRQNLTIRNPPIFILWGFTFSTDKGSTQLNKFRFCIRFLKKRIDIFESGIRKLVVKEPIVEGDVFSIEKKNNSIIYYKNGVVLRNVPLKTAQTSKTLLSDFALYTGPGRVIDLDVEASYGFTPSNTTPGYFELTNTPNGGLVQAEAQKLKIKFIQEYPIDSGTAIPIKISGNNNSYSGTLSNIAYGVNWETLYLPSFGLSAGDHIYLLEMTANKGNKYYLKFKY